jgi:hypothetical protein
VSLRCMVKGVYKMVMKNKLKAYPKLPIELSSTNDAIVVFERLRLRPIEDKSVGILQPALIALMYLRRP